MREEWLPRNTGKQLRVLSVPCSTGEEPYSIAMCLADVGIEAAVSQIDAIDISTENLDKAKRAHYGKNSFRGDDLSFRDRFFRKVEKGYILNDDIRKRVSFNQANIISGNFMAGQAPYDVIFCRNLLIYFDRPTQDQAIKVLERLLDDKGAFFIGHAEAGLLLEDWSASTRYTQAFVFRKRSDDRRGTERPRASNTRVRKQIPSIERQPKPAPARPFSRAAALIRNAAAPQPAKTGSLSTSLMEAQKLADSGHLAEAGDICETHIRDHSPSADAFHLLGLVREAAGQSEQAEEFWRKAIYLDPNHVEALTHLSLISERNGNKKAARLLRQRAERAQERTATASSSR